MRKAVKMNKDQPKNGLTITTTLIYVHTYVHVYVHTYVRMYNCRVDAVVFRSGILHK